MQRQCSIPDCGNIHRSQGLCSKHHRRRLRYGDPLHNPRPSGTTRFWSRVQKTDTCWLWTGQEDCQGYGCLSIGGRRVKAHRFSWELAYGPIPARMVGADGVEDATCVLHNCPSGDNPACVNPTHLWLGTNWDNTQDKIAKGRELILRGERNGMAKLTADDVLAIRALRAQGVRRSELATRFHVTALTIRNVDLRLTWQHVPGHVIS